MIGSQVQHYKILEKIGEGGMGEVYLAQDTRLERQVALKFLPPAYSKDPEFKARFEHEAKAAAALNHPNIITVYELGEHEGRTFIAMELIDGQTLEARIEAGDLTLKQALSISEQICAALAAAHHANIVHRDIKPANIFIGRDGRVKLLDFGLAKSRRATTETRAGTTVGTVQYESPEQSRGEQVDARSDLFSFGVVLYEMITGQRPFKGEFEDGVRYAIANDQPEPLARFKANVPDDLQRIVSRLLEKDPDHRYQSAADVVAELKVLQRDSGPRPSAVHSAVGSTASQIAAAPPAKKGGLGRLLIPSVAVVAIIFLLLVFKPWKLEVSSTQNATAAEDRLAVMYFDNLSDPEDAKRQGEVVSSLLISDLSESQYLQVVSSQRLYDILKNMGKEGTRKITPDVATEVARKANARWMMTGRILSSEPNWVVQAELSDVATGDLIASPSVTGQPGERIFELVDRLTRDIKSQLELPAEALAELDKPVIELTTESSDAYRLYLEAEDLKNRFLMQEAEAKYREALGHDSTFAMAYMGIQACRISYWNDYRAAREAVQQAYTFVEHTTERDSLYITGIHESIEGRPEAGIKVLEDLISRFPDDKEALTRMANMYHYNSKLRDIPRAIALYRQAMEIDPLATGPYNALAYAYDAIGDLEQSLWAINKYIELTPDDPNPYDSRGELQARNGQFDEALASYLLALERKPDFLPSLQGVIGLSLLRGDYETADRLADQMDRHENPDVRSRAYSQRATTAVYRGRIHSALDLLAARARFDAGIPDLQYRLAGAHVFRGHLYSFLHDDGRALKELDLAVEIRTELDGADRAEFSIQDDRVYVLARAGRIAEADSLLDVLRKSVGDPDGIDSSYYWDMRAYIHLHDGKYDSAITYYRRSAGPLIDFSEQVELGRAYAGARRFRDAQKHFELALSIFDDSRRNSTLNSVLIHYWLAQVYEKSGKTPQAIEQYRTFLDVWKDADPGIEEVEDAKQRLAALGA